MPSRTRRFFLNALSLTLTALLMRGVGMVFNIYVSSRAGSEAMGLYSLIGSVYGFSITLAAAGINLGTTRLIADALGKNDAALARRAAKVALLTCSFTGGLASLLLLFSAPLLGTRLLGDMRTVLSLRILSISLLPIAVCSCLSGYFSAVRRVKANAAFQVIIQIAKIGITLLLLSLLVEKGTEEACIALVLGSVLSELLSLLVTYLLYRFDLHQLKPNEERREKGVLKQLLGITLPVTFSACIRSALTMLQHILVPRGLKASGRSWSAALSSYGALHGMALPLVLLPSALTSAFSGLLIPEISECCAIGATERLRRVSYRALTLSLIFSFGTSGIMLFFSRELGLLIYGSEETALYIRVLAPLIPVMYIDSTVDAILKGSGHQVYSMNVNIADALTACLLALTLIPALGIWGYVISIYATELLNTTLSLYKMLSVSGMQPRICHQVLLPVLCVIGATNGARLLLYLLPRFSNSVLRIIFEILITSLLYVLLLRLTRALGKEEEEVLRASLMSQKTSQ